MAPGLIPMGLYTIERPWINNVKNISCIPEGFYVVERRHSPRFGDDMWMVIDVPNRTDILIHVANRASDVQGCIGIGTSVYPDLSGVGNSRDGIKSFYEQTEGLDSFLLVVSSGPLDL
jgi:hypothetical protein